MIPKPGICSAVVLSLCLAVSALPSLAEDEDEEERPFAQLDLRGAKALHPLNVGGEQVDVQPSEEHFVYMVEDALRPWATNRASLCSARRNSRTSSPTSSTTRRS